jgi:2-polyprenyl-3-methyl-5-hydroxy-6-metoxy-1,4-benzoquinol methylase
MVDAARFWDKTAEKYSKTPVRDEEGYRKKLEKTRSYFTSESTVFEFGCGTGSTAIAHAPFVKRIDCIDISSKMLEIAQQKAEREGIFNITFQQATIERFNASADSYDVVMAHSILHLLENPGFAIAKAAKLLKPGGAFVTSTVCLGDSSSLWKYLLPVLKFFRVIPDVKTLTRRQLDQLFADAGFEVDYQWNQGNKIPVAFVILKKPAV